MLCDSLSMDQMTFCLYLPWLAICRIETLGDFRTERALHVSALARGRTL